MNVHTIEEMQQVFRGKMPDLMNHHIEEQYPLRGTPPSVESFPSLSGELESRVLSTWANYAAADHTEVREQERSLEIVQFDNLGRVYRRLVVT